MKIRASSLPDLLDCAARWEAKHIKKLRLPTSGKAQLGTAVHAGTAAFDSSILVKNPVTVDDAAGEVVDAIWKPRAEVVWGDDLGQREAENIALDLYRKYCQNIAPQQEYVAVEQTCDALEIADIGITLTGTTDRVRKTPDGLGIVDLKTGFAGGSGGSPGGTGCSSSTTCYSGSNGYGYRSGGGLGGSGGGDDTPGIGGVRQHQGGWGLPPLYNNGHQDHQMRQGNGGWGGGAGGCGGTCTVAGGGACSGRVVIYF